MNNQPALGWALYKKSGYWLSKGHSFKIVQSDTKLGTPFELSQGGSLCGQFTTLAEAKENAEVLANRK